MTFRLKLQQQIVDIENAEKEKKKILTWSRYYFSKQIAFIFLSASLNLCFESVGILYIRILKIFELIMNWWGWYVKMKCLKPL